MTDGERIAVLETQVSNLKWLFGVAVAGVLAVFGVSNFLLLPEGAKTEVKEQLPSAVEAAVKKADVMKQLNAILAQAEADGTRIKESSRTAQADSAEIRKLRANSAHLPQDVRIIAGTMWSSLRAVDAALAKAPTGDVAGVSSYRNILGRFQSQLGQVFGFDPDKTPQDTNVAEKDVVDRQKR